MACQLDPTIVTHQSECSKKLNGVNCGNIFAKWGKMDEILLNGVISVKNVKIGGKNRNLTLKLNSNGTFYPLV